jgi:hypothetical protein
VLCSELSKPFVRDYVQEAMFSKRELRIKGDSLRPRNARVIVPTDPIATFIPAKEKPRNLRKLRITQVRVVSPAGTFAKFAHFMANLAKTYSLPVIFAKSRWQR